MTELMTPFGLTILGLVLNLGTAYGTIQWLKADVFDAKKDANSALDQLKEHVKETAAYRERAALLFVTSTSMERLEQRLEQRLDKIMDAVSRMAPNDKRQ